MKLKKLMAAGFITAALTLMMSMNAFAFGWQMTNGRWWYGTNGNNTTWLANQWMLIDGYWYYFEQSGPEPVDRRLLCGQFRRDAYQHLDTGRLLGRC